MANLTPIRKTYEALVDFKVPEYLYHYTTIDALKSIVESRIFRATHRSYLNDCLELRYGLQECTAHVRAWTDGRSGDERRIGEEVLKKLEETDLNTPFAYSASFTEEGDGPKQWKCYGSGGQGIAMCLQSEGLADSLLEAEFFDAESGEITAPHFFLNRLEYDRRIQKAQIVQLLDVAADCWPSVLADTPDSPDARCPKEVVAHAASHFLRLLWFKTFKHKDYIHEKEWRAIPHIIGRKSVKCDPTKADTRPYIEVAFDPACIKGIVVGSAVPFEDERRSLQSFLEQHGLAKVEIRRSEIPPAPNDA